MLAEQFHAAAAAARNTAAVDEIARLTWRAHAEGQILDVEAEAISEALQAPQERPSRPEGRQAAMPATWAPGPPEAHARQTDKPRSSAVVAKP